MENTQMKELEAITLAPYIQKATALIGLGRKIGGNQFRHAMGTLAILIDYGYVDSVLLKAAVIHDLFEDIPNSRPEEIQALDDEGTAVAQLVDEVTRKAEPKAVFMERIRDCGSDRSKILKSADRISNLTDLQPGVFSSERIEAYLQETETYVVPMAHDVNPYMVIELEDLIRRRRDVIRLIEG